MHESVLQLGGAVIQNSIVRNPNDGIIAVQSLSEPGLSPKGHCSGLSCQVGDCRFRGLDVRVKAAIMRSVSFVTNIVPVYRYPIFGSLHRIGSFRFQILVTVPLSGSYREAVATLPMKHSASLNLHYTTNHESTGASQREPLSIPLAVVVDLIRYRPDIIVAGDLGVRSLLCWFTAKCIGSRFVLWCEDIASSANGRSNTQRRLRRFLVKRADAFLAWGEPAQRYIESFGVQRNRIFTCAQAIDNEYWLRQAQRLDRETERRALGLSGVVFLLVGRALPLKGFQNFLQAWSRLPKELHPKISAVLVGDGDFLHGLRTLAAERGLNNVKFVGAKPADELARFYAAADIFVFPSLVDVWGLVVNEAMCFGLPILASQHAGASQALVANSNIGVVFNPSDIDEFALRLRAWIDSPPLPDPQLCRQMLEKISFSASTAAIQQMVSRVASL
jgi:glycosyltransferase involved in cell wall biosynthesis